LELVYFHQSANVGLYISKQIGEFIDTCFISCIYECSLGLFSTKLTNLSISLFNLETVLAEDAVAVKNKSSFISETLLTFVSMVLLLLLHIDYRLIIVKSILQSINLVNFNSSQISYPADGIEYATARSNRFDSIKIEDRTV